ncbi:cell surface protein [Helicobacter cynogastricus]|uniref:cell surface protein n=1 Tax=Helicobacter cynogastricus TaxID=329937 RepID=UPI000CF10944|nr:cell surface protein [Helicobacter cynogastricus]
MREVLRAFCACKFYTISIAYIALTLGVAGCWEQPDNNQNSQNQASQYNATPSPQPHIQLVSIKKEAPKKVIFSQENYYPLNGQEVGVSESNNHLFLEIYSFKLQKFMQGEDFLTKRQTQIFALNNSSTQITNVEGKLKTYKYTQKPEKEAKINTAYQRYSLKPYTPTRFEIEGIQKIPYKFNTTDCRIVISKQLIDTFAHSKEISINLDFKRELRNKATFELYLECPR